MRLILPPSETKKDGISATPLVLADLSFPELTSSREKLIATLQKISKGPLPRARIILGVSARQDHELMRNVNLRTAATAPAWQIYDGVLYDALDAGTLSKTEMARLQQSTLVGSALYGLVGMGDLIAPYRLSGDCVLPNVASLSAFWQPKLKGLIDAQSELAIDLRSAMYLKLGPVPGALIPRILERVQNGPPKVVSHFNKAAKGRLARALVSAKSHPRTAQDVAELAAGLGWDVELFEPTKVGGSQRLDCVVDSVH